MVVNVGLATSAAAYSTTGCKWANGPNVTYWINMGSGTNRTAAQATLTSWSTLTDVNLSSSGSSNFSITSKNDGASGYDGRTTWLCLLGVTTSAESWVNTHYTSSYVLRKIEAVYSHEVGHGLGLGHGSNNAVIMYTCAACVYNIHGYYWPQTDDRNGMNSLY